MKHEKQPFLIQTLSLLLGSLLLFSATIATANPKYEAPLVPIPEVPNAQNTETLPQYQVEVIVFQSLALKGWTEEYWPHYQAPVDLPLTMDEQQEKLNSEQGSSVETRSTLQARLNRADDLNAPIGTVTNRVNGYQYPVELFENATTASGNKAWLLAEEASKMTPAKGYQILLHKTWIMTGYPENQAQNFPLESIPETENGSLLEGYLQFYKSRYAHIRFNLDLERRIPYRIREAFADHERMPLEDLPDFWRFNLTEKRKIKSGELHYLDHPIFGVLVKMQYIKGSMNKIRP